MSWTIPNTLTAGATENINDVTTNLNSLAADTEFAYSSYKHILGRSGLFNSTLGAATYLLGQNSALASSAPSSGMVFYLDPADYAVTGRTTKYRVRASCYTNATAPLNTLTVGLYPVSAVAGGAGVLTATVGTVTSGSTVAFAAQAASTRALNNSGDFTAPAAGHYMVGVAVSAGAAANAILHIDAMLQVRQT